MVEIILKITEKNKEHEITSFYLTVTSSLLS